MADSDEEEDSQGTIPNALATSQEASHKIDDTKSSRTEGQREASIRADEGTVEDIRLQDAVEDLGVAKTEGEQAVSDSANSGGQDGREDDLVSEIEKAGSDGDMPIEDYGDIDELQRDHYNATPSAQLERILDRRTRIVGGIRKQSLPFARDGSDASSVPSSPLSVLSPPPIPAFTVAELGDSVLKHAQSEPARDISEFAHLPPNLGSFPPPDEEHPCTKPTRSLRHRNAIQLHPYLVESEKYRQSFKARGLRPLCMDPEDARALERESQNAAYNAEKSQPRDDEGGPYSSSPVGSPDTSTLAARKQNDVFVLGEDELPDMNALLQNPSRRYVSNGYKRRKTATATFRITPRLPPDQRGPMVVIPMLEADDGLFDVPPSPPHSRSQTPLKVNHTKKPKFRMPRGPAPAALPTPVASSEPRRRAFLEVSDGEESDRNVRKGTQGTQVAGLSDSSDTSASSSEDEPSHQLHRVQRKIRGVLPASWLKLDLKSQKKRSDVSREVHRSTSPEGISTQRGVARPVAPSRFKSVYAMDSRFEPIVLSDENDSESAEGGSPQRSHVDRSHLIVQDDEDLFISGRLGEAAEDDQVDAMLPTSSRAHAPHRTEKKRRKLAGIGSNSRSIAPSIGKKSRTQSHSQPRITDNFDKEHKRKPVFRPPNLSILDAPSMRRSSPTPLPRFVKIASRTTRSRNDKGRHSPSRKYIRLATKDDDNDTYETLRNWREGTIAPLRRAAFEDATVRRPLVPRSGNDSLSFSHIDPPKVIKEFRKTPAEIMSGKSHVRSTKSQSLQTSLDNLLQRQRKGRAGSAANLDSERPLRVDNKPKKRGQIVFSLQASSNARPAMLESARQGEHDIHAQAIFQRDLARINHFDDRSGLPNVLRLFEDQQRPASETAHQPAIRPRDQQRSTKFNSANSKPVPHRSRKRRPQRMDVPAPWSRPPSTPIVVDDFTDETAHVEPPNVGSKDLLLGLGPFGTRYSINLDVIPLPTGTCFHDITGLGSGTFARSLKLSDSRGLDSSRGFKTWTHGDRTLRWGPWTDTVSSELEEVITLVNQAVQEMSMRRQQAIENTAYEKTVFLLTNIIGYFSDHLSFLDPVDRFSCIQRLKALVSALLAEILSQGNGSNRPEREAIRELQLVFRISVSTLILMLSNQLRQLADHEVIPRQLQEEAKFLMHKAAQQTLSLALTGRLQEFEACLSRFQNPDAASYILDQQPTIEAFIVAQHVFRQQSDCRLDVLHNLQTEMPTKSSDGAFDVRSVERSWKKLFTLLPFLEFDVQGTLETGRRFKVALDNWTLVKRMISPVLEASLKTPRGQASSFNAYCRTLFGRCLHLINGWGWRSCDSIIGTLFDFFARNNLGHLRNEETHGSPLFLEQLDKKPSLSAEPEDRCFHILLKIIASGLKHMRQMYSEKKIRDIVWRLMPNHGRFHPKEEAIHQEDLDALRNHHDLISTLYWASPPSCRPRLRIIRNLVHLETSHREACHINIRAWFNLVKFQLSTNEPVVSLKPFGEWHDDLLQQILRQHALARTEAEEHFRSVQYAGGFAISEELLESTIAKNQRQVEAILSDALVSLKLAIDAAQNEEAATVLMSPTLSRVFELFDGRRTQAIKTVIQALYVLSAYANRILAAQQSRDDNDDSQDYGDWTAFDDDNTRTKQADEAASPLQTLQQPLRHLLSNCFGADLVPEDSILLKLVDVWVAVAQMLVRSGIKSWIDYIDRFGSDTWSSLRDTEQTRKYTAYFLATLIDRDGDIYRDHQTYFLTSWIGSLVERESVLKFQHLLTETLLNASADNSLLKNLPFSSDPSNGRIQITAAEFSERRLSLISSVLSNMRVSLEQAVFDSAVDAAQLRQEYKDLLKHLMGTMKHNYQELGHGSNIRGAYVDFVHGVVSFLQQHTSAICPIDRFFTDNGAFPLPAADPTYVVGQLKNYALRLQDQRTPKQLAVFLQSVSERAAVDGQQPYLVDQLHAAMSNAFEASVAAKPTLRSFIIKAIIPAYTSLAFTTQSGWILALPFLLALRKVFSELLLDLDGCDYDSVAAVASIVTVFLDSVRRSLGVLLYPSGLLGEGRFLKTLSAYYAAITAILPVLDYLDRLYGPTQRAVENVDFLRSFANYTSSLIYRHNNALAPEIDDSESATYPDTRNFATRELRDTLTKNWVYDDERYYVVRGASRREVVVDTGLYEEEKQQLLATFGKFSECLGAMPSLRDDDEEGLVLRNTVTELDDLIV